MEYPMRVYGLNVVELLLTDLLAVLGWLMVAFAVAAAVFAEAVFPGGFVGGALCAGTGAAGLLFLLGSTGVRQNRAALDVGYGVLTLAGLGWIAAGVFPLPVRAAPVAAGAVLLLLLALALFTHRVANLHRFSPRYLSLRQFETMIQVAETMIDADGKEAIHPIEVAIRVDRLLSELDSPVRGDLRTALVLVEWLLPWLIFRPIPFSDLGSNERRRAVEKVIGAKGPFRIVARTLKTAACVGYYGSEEAMAQVGYVPFEERQRAQGADQTPARYPDPFLAPLQGADLEVSPVAAKPAEQVS